jgi:phage terminase small subunit
MAPQKKKAAPVGGNTPVKKEPTPKPDNAIDEQQQRFINAYLTMQNPCATQAALEAGYGNGKRTSAAVQGNRLLRNVNVSTRIAELQAQRAKEVEIDAKWVLNRLVSISNRCMQAEPVMIFSPADKAMVHKEDDEGNKVYQFDSTGANKATEMIGKHIGFFEKDNDQKKGEIVLTIGGKEVNE